MQKLCSKSFQIKLRAHKLNNVLSVKLFAKKMRAVITLLVQSVSINGVGFANQNIINNMSF